MFRRQFEENADRTSELGLVRQLGEVVDDEVRQQSSAEGGV